MKVLLKKIKRSNKTLLFIFSLSILMFLFGFIAFGISIFKLVGIETFIRVFIFVFFLFWFLFYILYGLINLVTNKVRKFLILTIIHMILFIVILLSSVFINHFYEKLEMLTNKEYTLYTTNLIALKETEFSNTSKIGMISNNEDVEGYILANTLLNHNNLQNETTYFDDYYSMLDALYNKEIDAIFVSSNYTILFSGEEIYENIGEETKVLYEYSEKMKTKTNMNTNKKLTEPFTVLLMGVDSEKNGLNANAAFNGDTLMLVSFNPQTLNATMLSLPRDLYVPIACNNNRSHKINSSAAYGTDCVINTIENLMDIQIDYSAKINFHGVIDLVDTLGGIDVFVEAPDYSVYIHQYGEGKLCESNHVRDITHPVCMDVGMQHLNGEQALAYARNRHGFLESDLARNRHQQQIVEAIAKKLLTIKSFSEFENLLDVIGNNISTNLSTETILSFYQTLKSMLTEGLKGNDFITIQKTYLEVYNLPVTIGNLQLSALGYHENSLLKIRDAFKVNLGLKEEEIIKTFSYDFNEEYTSPIIGKGITGGTSEETVPNFVGDTVNSATEWANKHHITLTKEFICSDDVPGVIGKQSVSAGTLARNTSVLTIYINEACKDESENENKEENDTSSNQNQNPQESDTDSPNVTDPSLGGPENNTTDNDSNGNNTENNDSTDVVPPIPGLPNDTTEDN